MAARRIIFRDNINLEISHLKFFRNEAKGVVRCAAAVVAGDIGPGLGGARQLRWESDAAMMEDVVLLAMGMHSKSAFQELPFCGGKMCLELAPDANVEDAYEEVGRFVESFGGQFITTEDMGSSPQKMSFMRTYANGYVLGCRVEDGGSGDPSPMTALGVAESIGVVAEYLGIPMQRLKVFVKGYGNVGRNVCDRLLKEGVHVIVSETDKQRRSDAVQKGLELVPSLDHVSADVFCPCAGGGDVSVDFDQTRFRAIVGAANNQLVCDEVAETLFQKNVVYVPDWVCNAGGLLSVAAEHLGETRNWVVEKTESIAHRVHQLLEKSRQENRSPLDVALEQCYGSVVTH